MTFTSNGLLTALKRKWCQIVRHRWKCATSYHKERHNWKWTWCHHAPLWCTKCFKPAASESRLHCLKCSSRICISSNGHCSRRWWMKGKRCTKFLCYVLSPKMSSHKCAQNLRLKLKVTETVILVHSLCMHPLTLLFSRSGLFVTTVKSKVYTQ